MFLDSRLETKDSGPNGASNKLPSEFNRRLIYSCMQYLYISVIHKYSKFVVF